MQKDTKLSANKLNVSADTRRNFLKKASIGAPILLATSTKPAWGANCLSGMMSGNLSNQTPVCTTRAGLNGTFWKSSYVKNTSNQNYGKFKYKHNGNWKKSRVTLSTPVGNHGSAQSLLNQGGAYSELAAAFINADMCDKYSSIPVFANYPYKQTDVLDILDAIALGNADAATVEDILKQVHS